MRLDAQFAVLDLSIANASSDEPVRSSNGGHGLIGMRERATLLGGCFDAVQVDGVFRVRAQLPYAGANS